MTGMQYNGVTSVRQLEDEILWRCLETRAVACSTGPRPGFYGTQVLDPLPLPTSSKAVTTMVSYRLSKSPLVPSIALDGRPGMHWPVVQLDLTCKHPLIRWSTHVRDSRERA